MFMNSSAGDTKGKKKKKVYKNNFGGQLFFIIAKHIAPVRRTLQR